MLNSLFYLHAFILLTSLVVFLANSGKIIVNRKGTDSQALWMGIGFLVFFADAFFLMAEGGI